MKDKSNLYNIKDTNNSSDELYVLEDEEYLKYDDSDGSSTDNDADINDASPAYISACDSKTVFLIILKILISPVEGWKDLRRSKISVDVMASGCFYPIIALAAVSEFTGLLYDSEFMLSSGVIHGLITFITFFLSYFSSLLFTEISLPKSVKEKINSNFGKEYFMMNISTLAIFYILYRILPFLGPVLAFTPFWTIYISIKGVKLFRIEEVLKTRVSTTLCVMIIGCPLLWNWIFSEIFPF